MFVRLFSHEFSPPPPHSDLSNNYFTGALVKPANVLAVLSFNYLSGVLLQQQPDALDANCFKLPDGETSPVQRPQSACRAFCGIAIGSTSARCSETVIAAPLEKAILPPSTVLTTGTKKEKKGTFTSDPVPLFVYEKGRENPGCGFELAFSVNFTFTLSPKGKAVSNGFAFVVSANNTVGSDAGVGYGGMNTRSMAIEFDVLQTKPHLDMKDQHVGLNIQGQDKSIAAVKSPFMLTDKKAYTAWVDYVPGDPGTILVYLSNTTVKPAKPLLERRLSLCALLQPGPPQAEQVEQQRPRAFYFGFVASTTVKPFMIQTILISALRTDAPPARGTVNINPGKTLHTRSYGLTIAVNTFVPARASPFPRYVSADYRVSAGQKDSWVFRDLHSWDSVPFLGWPVKDQDDCNACWAFAVVSSIEAAYGIATYLEAPKLSVDSLFTAMNLTSQADRCTAGGSPTEAFEKLLALPKGGLNIEGNLMSLKNNFWVQRQPVVVHIEASAVSFTKYDGTFKYQDPGCYTGNLNHVVLVVGYFVLRNDGSENRIAPPFWIVRNSWGEEWGDRGHMRMDIQGGDGVCGINVLPGIYPIVKIPGDPCGLKSYKGDGDLQPSMNPCGRFTCKPITKTNSNTCTCSLPAQTKQPFVEAVNGYGNTCAYVDVCGSYFKNPCTVGTCINNGKGAYSCICPPNYVNSTTIDKFPTCDPANTTATNMTVIGDNWFCSDVYPLAGLLYAQFIQQNPALVCTNALPRGTVIQLIDTPAIPCTAYFYSLSGDTCVSIADSVRLTRDDLMDLNPGLDCTQTIKPGRSICVERNETYAYSVPECVKYATLTAQDTCERLLQGLGLQNNPSNWAELYRNNPGLVCASTIPGSSLAVGSNAGVQLGEDVQWRFRPDSLAYSQQTKRDAVAQRAIRALLPVDQRNHFRHVTFPPPSSQLPPSLLPASPLPPPSFPPPSSQLPPSLLPASPLPTACFTPPSSLLPPSLPLASPLPPPCFPPPSALLPPMCLSSPSPCASPPPPHVPLLPLPMCLSSSSHAQQGGSATELGTSSFSIHPLFLPPPDSLQGYLAFIHIRKEEGGRRCN
ncbi:unnamed protein product [Closterium sp. NIES-65]|nr:unnamed protein product [Closterium sp. NIES-65]